VAEVRVALAALHFRARHAVAAIGFFHYIFLGDRRVETGPTGAGIEFGVGAEEFGAATHAAENAFVMNVKIRAGEWRLGGGVARYFKLVLR
jgi:hypothetical protein